MRRKDLVRSSQRKYGVREDDGVHLKERSRASHIWKDELWG